MQPRKRTFKSISNDFYEGRIGQLDALYLMIKNAGELGKPEDIRDIGIELMQSLKSYVNTYDPARRSYPDPPPTPKQVALIKQWLETSGSFNEKI